MIPRYIRNAARWWDHHVLYPRRRAKLMQALGVEDTVTKFDLARKRRQATEPHLKTIRAAAHEKLRQELGHG